MQNQNRELNHKNEFIENLIREKEIEFLQMLEKKDFDFENLMKILKDVENELKFLEEGSQTKITELNQIIENLEIENNNMLNELNNKANYITEIENDLTNHKNLINNIQEQSHKLTNKFKDSEEIRGDFQKTIKELSQQLEETSNELTLIKQEKENLIQEKCELTVQIKMKNDKISNLNDIIEGKERKLSKDMKRERKSRDISGKTNKELIGDLNEIEETHKKEMFKLKNHFLNMIENINFEKQCLIHEMNEIRQCCSFIEKNLSR
jgi:chromosome segregation ATPase